MDVNDCRRNKQKNLIGYRNFLIDLIRPVSSIKSQKKKKKQQTNETQHIIPHPPSFNDGFILNF